ncbi:MAG: DNA primase [Hyphomicrobium sp. 32-62-53]|nr:MAG: DNA primase [Hyphomicrobium sp. 32-62-53]
MRFSPHLLDEIRARLAVSQVVGRKVALKKKGREWSGLSPFKMEKTPSFFVNDQKGFYHCFASGEHGDIFTFLIKTEGLTFPEAVERLAAEAGVTLPKPEVRDQEVYDQRQRLSAVLDASVTFFEEQLAGPGGAEARRYLTEKRGLRRETIKAFRLGYAPQSRTALKEYLTKAGFTVEEQALSGMLISGEDIREPYDRFRHRVMFPIGDWKGRTIAFGGRALDPDAPAKYLNSPETPLFHKGHNLYNAHLARAIAHDKERVIAVEGYMDVVALTEGGFAESVAPLGTALTPEQVALLWRMTPEPVLCFDGDSAGKKAAYRAIDTVLPMLKPGMSVRFAFLPDGLDPDDLVRQQGPEAMEAALSAAQPLAQVLFDREWAQDDWSTPERRARLEQQIRILTARIEDGSVRSHYEQDMRRRLQAAWGNDRSTAPFRPSRETGFGRQGVPGARPGANFRGMPAGGYPRGGGRPGAGGGRFGGYQGGYGGAGRGGAGFAGPGAVPIHALPSSSLLNSPLASGDQTRPGYREMLLIRTLINHSWLATEDAEALAQVTFVAPVLSRLRDAILAAVSLDNSLDSAGLRSHLVQTGFGGVLDLVDRSVTHKCDRFAEPNAGQAEVEAGWRHALALHDRQVGLKAALESAERAWHEDRDEDAFQRIRELQAEIERLARPGDLDENSEDAVAI